MLTVKRTKIVGAHGQERMNSSGTTAHIVGEGPAGGRVFMKSNVISMRDHPRASQAAGRGTSEGQSQSSGQFSENQVITPSYFLAVKVTEPAPKRSKKRQSPAAMRPTVVSSKSRASAKAEAQAMRLERSSVSITPDNSRSFPTAQEVGKEKVGIFQLAPDADRSDKSAMPTPDQIRHTLQRAMDRVPEGPVTVALDLGLERNYLRDFLEGKKSSLKAEVSFQLADRYGIPINELITIKEKQVRKRA